MVIIETRGAVAGVVVSAALVDWVACRSVLTVVLLAAHQLGVTVFASPGGGVLSCSRAQAGIVVDAVFTLAPVRTGVAFTFVNVGLAAHSWKKRKEKKEKVKNVKLQTATVL